MLADAVKKKQGKKVKRRSDSEISLEIEGFLPSSYIEDEQQKIEFYKRLRQANSHEEVVDIQDDMLDRFGDYPAEVDNLLQITDLKIIADQVQVERITRKDGILTVTMTRAASQKLTGGQIFEALSVTRLRATVAESDAKMHIKLVIQPRMTQKDWFTQLFNYIKKLKEYV
jgi:transcription-repair coupling factor (superfamily II helicase)